MRAEIERRIGIDALDLYGLSEVIGPGVAAECIETKDGLTIWEDHFFPEIIDPETGAVLPDGETRRTGVHLAHQGRHAGHPLSHARSHAAAARHGAHHAPHGSRQRTQRRHADHPRRQRFSLADRSDRWSARQQPRAALRTRSAPRRPAGRTRRAGRDAAGALGRSPSDAMQRCATQGRTTDQGPTSASPRRCASSHPAPSSARRARPSASSTSGRRIEGRTACHHRQPNRRSRSQACARAGIGKMRIEAWRAVGTARRPAITVATARAFRRSGSGRHDLLGAPAAESRHATSPSRPQPQDILDAARARARSAFSRPMRERSTTG